MTLSFRDVHCVAERRPNGIAGGDFDAYGTDPIIPRAMTAFTAIAWYNALEILIVIFIMFKRFSGLYFWSLVVTTIGVIPYATGMSYSFSTCIFRGRAVTIGRRLDQTE